MAERRMFSKSVIDSDEFIDMPLSAQALYFHLGMHADDEGFLNSPKRIQRSISASNDDMKLLIAKGFVIEFDSGIVVIRHWKVNNYLQKDRIKPTQHLAERELVQLVANREYVLGIDVPIKANLIEDPKKEKKKVTKHKYGEYNNVLLTDEEFQKLTDEFPDLSHRIDRLSEYVASSGKSYKSHYATIKAWARKDKQNRPENLYGGSF